MKRLLAAAGCALALAACNDQFGQNGKSLSPIPPQTVALMSEKGMTKSDPILVRVYKKESELEVWKKGIDGEYAMLKSYPICRWSGQLGPKRKEGDRQAPEGFYSIPPGQMNPNSAYYLSFDTGFPNAYDRSHGGTGSALMVHGTCSSRGCYAMTDEGIGEIYALARESFAGGQRAFQFQAYPFRMTAENLARFRNDPNMPFWRNLKEGSDAFEITRREPKVAVCGGRYAFNTVGNDCTADPTLQAALAEKDQHDRKEVAELVAKGMPAVRLVYQDGGQHESFRRTAFSAFGGDAGGNFAVLGATSRRNVGEVSRPEALAEGPREIPVDTPAAGKPARGIAVASADATAARKAAARPIALAGTEAAPSPAGTIPPATGATPESRSLYDSLVGGVFGSREEPQPKAAEAPAEPAAATLPPPRRKTAANASATDGNGIPVKPAAVRTAPAGKPQATRDVPRRHVDASDVMPGPQGSGGPHAGGFSRN